MIDTTSPEDRRRNATIATMAIRYSEEELTAARERMRTGYITLPFLSAWCLYIAINSNGPLAPVWFCCALLFGLWLARRLRVVMLIEEAIEDQRALMTWGRAL